MSNAKKKLARTAALAVRLGPTELERLRQLITRDQLSYAEFIRRAIQAYDLMYSRDA